MPSHIGQYRILRKIGAGGMGMVFLGEHTLLGRRAAIKTLLPTVAANAELVERFFNEARATSAISDPGVIQIFDFGYHVDRTAYIVMELLEGESLSARIARLGKLELGDVLRIARQISSSLAAAHARDIVHRDLKPDNIFLVHDAEAQGGERSKILDFGICKVASSDVHVTQSGAMIGTPVYMSPEQCRGTGPVDHRADIYALGCLMFHMLTGRPPFLGDSSGELIVAHLREEPPTISQLIPDLPLAIDVLVLRCLAKNPDDRFASMTELLASLVDLSSEVEAPYAAVPRVTPRTPLGRGFRSMYDGNFASLVGSAGGIPAALRPRLYGAPTPSSTPSPAMTPASNDDFEADEPASSMVVLPARRRAGVRAALAGVLVMGVVLGLVATTLVIDSNENRAAAQAAPHSAAPLAVEPPVTQPAIATTHAANPEAADEPVAPPSTAAERPAAGATADTRAAGDTADARAAGDTAVEARAAAAAASDRSRRPRDAVRGVSKAPPKPRTREPAAAPARPATSAPAAAASEDLYDTR